MKPVSFLTPQSQHHLQQSSQSQQQQQQQQQPQVSIESVSASATAEAQAQAQHRRSVAARLEQRRNRPSYHAQHGAGSQRGRRLSEERPAEYLHSTAYQQYRARQRRDAGDGDAVWPDALEDVFHKGMTNVKYWQ